eukprot:gene11352-8074_t
MSWLSLVVFLCTLSGINAGENNYWVTRSLGTGTQSTSATVGLGSSTQVYQPFSVVADITGDLYVSDQAYVRKIPIATSIMSVYAGKGISTAYDGTVAATSSKIDTPYGIWVNNVATGSAFTYLYVSMGGSTHSVFRIDASTTKILKIAGCSTSGTASATDVAGSSACFNTPIALWGDSNNEYLYVSDYGNSKLRRISLTSGTYTTSVIASSVSISSPTQIWGSANGDLYFANRGLFKVQKLSYPSYSTATTIIGTGVNGSVVDGSTGSTSKIGYIEGLAVDTSGNMFLSDSSYARIYQYDMTNDVVYNVAGGGTSIANNIPAASLQLSSVKQLFLWGTTLYVGNSKKFCLHK